MEWIKSRLICWVGYLSPLLERSLIICKWRSGLGFSSNAIAKAPLLLDIQSIERELVGLCHLLEIYPGNHGTFQAVPSLKSFDLIRRAMGPLTECVVCSV